MNDALAWGYYYVQNGERFKKNRKLSYYLYLPVCFIGLLVTAYDLVKSVTTNAGGFLAIICAAGVIITGSGVFYYLNFNNTWRGKVRKIFNKAYADGKNSLIGAHKYTFSPEGIQDTTALHNDTVKWAAIKNIVQNAEYLFVVRRPDNAYILPKRAFPNQAAFNLFAQNLKEMFAASQKTN
jgi:hypothetical protein